MSQDVAKRTHNITSILNNFESLIKMSIKKDVPIKLTRKALKISTSYQT